MSRNVRYALIILVVILLWLISGFIFNNDENETVQESDGTTLTKVVVTASQAALYQPVLRFNARTEAFREGTIRAQTGGPVLEIILDEGATVNEGDVIALLDVEDRELRVRESKAFLNQAELEYKAALSLKEKGLLSDADVARNQSSLNSAQTAVDTAELELERISVKASFGGLINERLVELGDFVQRGEVVAEVLQLDPIKAVFRASETEVIALDTETTVYLELSDGRKLEGEFLFRSAKADEINRTFLVEAVFANPDKKILADLTGAVFVQQKELYAHALPASILALNTKGELIVKVVNSEDVVESHVVDIVNDHLDKVWVTGLPESANVITRGYEYVGLGEKVDVSYSEQSAE